MEALAVMTPEQWVGDARILTTPPSWRLYQNVLFDPRYFGLFDEENRIIDGSAFRRGGDGALVRSRAVHPGDLPVEDQIEKEVVYMGGLLDHFGHFVCTSLSRMWAWSEFRDHRFLFHGWPLSKVATMSVARLCFDHHGVCADRVLQPDRPVRLRRAIVPQSAFDEQSNAFMAYRGACLDVARGLGDAASGPVYLSKTRLHGGVQRIANEADLEDALASAGVRIFHPQEMPIQDQIALHASGATVLGSAGSAFHVQVFAERPGRRIILAPAGVLNANQALFDGLVGQPSLCVAPTTPSQARPGAKGEAVTQYMLADPRGVASALLSLI